MLWLWLCVTCTRHMDLSFVSPSVCFLIIILQVLYILINFRDVRSVNRTCVCIAQLPSPPHFSPRIVSTVQYFPSTD